MKMLALIPLTALVATAAPAAAQSGDWTGTWRNAKNSVRLKAARCGAGMCARVVWASPAARAAAADGGTPDLVGTELLHDFRRDADGLWYGEVYVPDIAQTFSGTIEQRGRDTLVASGCLFAGFGCKTQVWTRVAAK